MSKLVMIIEDEPKIAQVLVDYLQQQQYEACVISDGAHAAEQIVLREPIFVFLDVMLPNKDGLTICREVREVSKVPILMLTAKVDEIDRLIGLEIGADDYVCKPFSPREVMARMRTILRRVDDYPATHATSNHSYRNIQLDLDRMECWAKDQIIILTPIEFRLMSKLISQPGRVFSRTHLMDAGYTDGRTVSDRTIDSHMKNLRKKIRQVCENDYVHSVYGVGYKLE